MERVTSMAGTMVEEFFPGESMEGEGGDMSLEWLSTFVEDCLSGGFTTPFTIPTTTTTTTTNNNNKKPHQTPTTTHQTPTPPKPPQTEPSLNDPATAIPSRARTKRRKLSSRPNPQAFLPNPSHPTLLPQAYWLADSELILPKKEQQEERKPAEDKVGKDESPGQARRCSHCLSQKTPQWRAGPLGPKTLCNACGVRFKSGRLLPEYRPAKSPTFVSYKHSNSHKKVMEMRMAK